MNARVPTLPTPTTLRAASTNSKRSSSRRRSGLQRPAVGRELLLDQLSRVLGERRDRSCARRAGAPRTAAGSRSGTGRRRALPSLASACRLSRPRAFRAASLARFSCFFKVFWSLPAPERSVIAACTARHQVCLREVGVPDVQRLHLRELRHRLAVGGGRGPGHRTHVVLGEAPVPGCDGEARRQPLHVVLEGPGQRLVEVVDVEDQRPLGLSRRRRSWTGARHRTAARPVRPSACARGPRP